MKKRVLTFHYTYITRYEGSDKYYIGRHSTKNLCDGYRGSGTWVRSIKDRSKLVTNILAFYPSQKDLKEAEQILLNEHIDNPNCMNMNNRAEGFACGDLNPACRPEEMERRSKYNWMKTPEGKAFYYTCLPSCGKEARRKISDAIKHLWDDPEYRAARSGENHHTKSEEWSQFMKENNPMYSDEQKARHSEHLKELAKEGKHPFQDPEYRKKMAPIKSKQMKENNPMHNPDIVAQFRKPHKKVPCTICGVEMSASLMKGYHIKGCAERNNLDPIEERKKLDAVYPAKSKKK